MPSSLIQARTEHHTVGGTPLGLWFGSISLGIFNLLPIPALDGGRAVFILVEMLRGRPVDPEKEALVHIGGFAVLIVLMIVVSYHDIARAVAGQGAF